MYLNGTKCSFLIFCCFLSLSLTAQTIPLPLVSSTGECVGYPIYLYANPDTTASGITYSWTGPGTFTSNQQNPIIPIASIANSGYYYVTDMIGGITSNVDSIFIAVSNTTPVSIAITVSPHDTVCRGTNVTFTATTSTGGATPTYQWVNGSTPVVGAIHSTWSSPTLVNGDVIYCILNSSLTCPTPVPANSNTITMNILNASPLVYISSNTGTTVAPGTSVTFSSVIYNAGISPIYQWSLNGANVAGANFPIFTLPSVTSFDTVSLTVTSTMACASPDFGQSNTVIVHAHTTGVANVTSSLDNVELFPNPNNGSFTIDGDLQSTAPVSVDVLNMIGQVVYTDNITTPGTHLNKAFDLHDLSNGIYMMRINQDGESKVLRFSVAR